MQVGRPSRFHQVFQVLDPAWLYCGPHIQELCQATGLMAFLDKQSFHSGLREWTRDFLPKEPDLMVLSQHARTSFWYGFRWQRFPNLSAARKVRSRVIAEFWDPCESQTPLSLATAIRARRLGGFASLLKRSLLQWYAMEQGLNPKSNYPPHGWAAPFTPNLFLDLAPLKTLHKDTLLSIDEVCQQCFPVENARLVRSKLYHRAREMVFPPFGDRMESTGLPLWAGSRWADAVEVRKE